MTPAAAAPRTLRTLWAALCAGATLAAAALLAVGGAPSMPEHAAAAFYGVALLSLVGSGAALLLLRRMESALLDAPDRAAVDRAAVLQTVQTYGLAALACVEMPALAGALAAFLTGELLALAFLVPLYAFAALTWPSDARLDRWASLGTRR